MKCAIPVFEGLLPKKHDRIVGKLLFELCTWHGLAKLWLHTETTVNDLEHSTTRLGKLLREFRKEVCSGYATKELPSEEAARIRRKAAAAKKLGQSAAPSIPDAPNSRQQRTFNLSTYKIHALGHYARAIRLFGTTDNFNSQTVTIYLFGLKKKLMVCLGRARTPTSKAVLQTCAQRQTRYWDWTASTTGTIHPPCTGTKSAVHYDPRHRRGCRRIAFDSSH